MCNAYYLNAINPQRGIPGNSHLLFPFPVSEQGSEKDKLWGVNPQVPPIGFPVILEYGEYDGVSIFSYEYFDIRDTQKVKFLEFVIMYVPVCLVFF